MSQYSGDKARFNRIRKARIRKRATLRQLRESIAARKAEKKA